MEKEFVPYELALRLKALGFDEPCIGYYNSNKKWSTKHDEYEVYFIENSKWIDPACSAPTFSQAFSFLIPLQQDEFKVSLCQNGWYIYNLEGELYDYDALEKMIEFVEKIKIT